MPENITGYQNTVQTLSPGTPVVTVSGTINAYGPAGVYTINTGKGPQSESFSAAVFGPQAGDFTVTNTGFILTQAGNPDNLADAGILLANSGLVYNSGTVIGASGVGILAQSGTAYIANSKFITGTVGVGIAGFDGPVTVHNAGDIAGHQEGIFLAGGGTVTNAGDGYIAGETSYGIDAHGLADVTNHGEISGFYGGVNLESGQGTVTNTGLIFASGQGSTEFYGGILTSDGGSVFNSGTVTGENGIAVQYSGSGTPNFSGYAENSGMIAAVTTLGAGSLGLGGQGGFGVGIAMNMAGTVVNSGHIFGSNAGIISQNNNTGTVDLLNAAAGHISGAKYGIYLRSGGDATNAGAIVVGEQGMTDIGGGTLVNRGYVDAYSAPFTVANASGTYIPTGLYLRGSGMIGNQAGGVVSVASGDGLFLQGVNFGSHGETLLDGNVTNAGTVNAFEGVYETSLGTFTNSGLITATQAGFLSPRVGAIVFNTGSILASTTLGVLESRADGFLSGGIGVYIDGGTVTNSALISGNHAAVAIDALTGLVLNDAGASLASALGYGVILSGGGGVVNDGAISGYRDGIRDQNGSATILNFGYIGAAGTTFTTTGTGSSHGLPAGSYVSQGLLLKDGGEVFNTAGATISGQTGVNLTFSAYIENAGLIDGRGRTGVYLKSGGTLVNQGSIHGAKHAVEFYSGTGTLINSGTISGGPTGDAVSFAPGFNNLLVVDPGARFMGQVDGGDSLSSPGFSVLELGVGDGTIQNVGTQFIDFTTIDFAPGADWTVGGNSAGLAGGELISGFATGDVLDISGISVTPQVLTIGADGVLYVPESLGTLTLHFTGEDGQTVSVTGDGGTGADIKLGNALCFCAGTQILTVHGEVPVEALAVGDLLVTASGAARPVRWIGRRQYDGRFISGNHLMLPVRIAAGALSKGVPHHDLSVSPGHALWVGGALVPAWRLINGVTITQADSVDEARYFHVELESHDLILAEGCPAESYYDDGSRAQFQNGAEAERLDRPGLPRVEHGPVLDAIQRRLGLAPAARPERLRGFVDAAGPGKVSGWAQNMDDPDAPVWLDICVAGRRVRRVLANIYRADLRAAGLGAGCHGFELEVGQGKVTVRCAATSEELRLTERALRAA